VRAFEFMGMYASVGLCVYVCSFVRLLIQNQTHMHRIECRRIGLDICFIYLLDENKENAVVAKKLIVRCIVHFVSSLCLRDVFRRDCGKRLNDCCRCLS
jgi:hypothetical protein